MLAEADSDPAGKSPMKKTVNGGSGSDGLLGTGQEELSKEELK